MKRISVIIVIFVTLLPFYSLAFQNEPDNFRGIKFGATIDKMPSMEKIQSTPNYSVYRIKGDEMEIDGIKLDDIRYMVREKVFFGVSCVFTGLSNFNELKELLVERHGEGVDRSKESKQDRDFIWYGTNFPVRIMITYNKSYGVGAVSYIYKTKRTLPK